VAKVGKSNQDRTISLTAAVRCCTNKHVVKAGQSGLDRRLLHADITPYKGHPVLFNQLKELHRQCARQGFSKCDPLDDGDLRLRSVISRSLVG
jgi:hypothetical protein